MVISTKFKIIEIISSLIEKREITDETAIPKDTKDIDNPNAKQIGPFLSSSRAVVIMIGSIGIMQGFKRVKSPAKYANNKLIKLLILLF